MKKFHPIRTAVTIGLIITMMIQPMVVVAAVPIDSKTGKPECSKTTAACEGCGCCEVQSPDQRCCCCGASEEASADPHSSRDPQASDSEGQSRASLLGVCLCGVMVPPMDRGDRCPERIMVRHVAMSEAVADESICRRPRSEAKPVHFLREAIPAPRYSQRCLCMWRI